VTNRSDGTVSVIDVRERKKVRDVATGPMPISLDYSKLARALYVADGREGVVVAVDGVRHEVVARIPVKPGLGPLRVTPDGRYVLAVNSLESVVHVIDASTNRVAHELAVGAEPYQIATTRNFAHVRSLGSGSAA
jgi:YVTN family beta-propeller protein